ncbi:MAG: hypothetical protein KAS63_05770 [Candidatus Heimdallarchaeota archaeon]|nr:hypothetical protein [Candidatus Heimdallarchaeota archaeon]MCK4954847.1 hypothetical protein [Candidatus Heimdallarchaeota archaeon]
MGVQKILPNDKQKTEEVVLLHKNGVIVAVNDSVYQVKIFRDPDRKIFSTSINNAYRILQIDGYDSSEDEGFYIRLSGM